MKTLLVFESYFSLQFRVLKDNRDCSQISQIMTTIFIFLLDICPKLQISIIFSFKTILMYSKLYNGQCRKFSPGIRWSISINNCRYMCTDNITLINKQVYVE